ncbi:hypothetical protein QTP86_033511, partial [Hemibagrus guttatus]
TTPSGHQTTDYYTCRNRCGYDNGLCSCTSSCRYSGNCCRDYNYYCSDLTSTPGSACGGSYYSSGFISSPYYPGYYHDNAYCLWQLQAPAGQTIFLSFQDFDLERCCNCDYVNVYDGPSTGSHLLGKLCHNDTNHLDFQSSSSFMTVLFRSDYSGVGRGFKAYFSSSLNHNTGRVNCSSDWMNIAIRKSYLDSLGFNWHDLYLDDHRCRPSTDYTYVTFNFPLDSCSTRRRTQNGRIIYTNNVRAAQSTSGEITRRYGHFLMFVSCVMERDSSVGTLYEAKEISNANITGTGRFNTTMSFYPSSSFSYPITESPYRVDLNQQLYVQVQLTRADPSLHLFIDTCVASPNNNFNIRNYDLIRNGCGRDSTVYIYKNGDRYFAQFSFRAFMFLRTHNQVFLRCDVIICADNDYGSRCRQGCRNRRKRSSSSDHRTEVLTLGPITLKDALNSFYTQFEVQNDVTARKTIPPPEDQLEDVFTDIFNISLNSAIIPTCLKTTTIIPVPKKSPVSCLNDYHRVALTPIILKCFKRLVMRQIKDLLPLSLDPMQFVYRPNWSTDNAITTTLHLALTHLENKDSYVRMLFIDFSSSFNTIIPQHLTEKLSLLGINTSLCNWILDCLTGRPQSFRIGNSTSSATTLNTGAPQCYVLSPLLFTLLTHDCAAMHSSNHIIKFTNDMTVVGLISKNDESAYREEVQILTAWCKVNNLSLNLEKMKEIVVDFRRAQSDHSPLNINGSNVEIVKSTKFLGVHLAEDLTWLLNTSSITKKA